MEEFGKTWNQARTHRRWKVFIVIYNYWLSWSSRYS